MYFAKLLVFVLFYFKETRCARILGVFFIPSISHQVVFQAIYRELSIRGHEVVVVTPNPLKDETLTSLTEIDTSYLYQTKLPQSSYYTGDDYIGFMKNIFDDFVFKVAENTLKDKNVQQLCQFENDKFDLVLTEAIIPVLYAFGNKCGAPTIGVISLDGFLHNHNAYGNPMHPYLYADYILPTYEPMTLHRKVLNIYYYLWYQWFYKFTVLTESDRLKQYIDKDLPSIAEIERNSSMLFVNTNFAVTQAKPRAPSTQILGFMHIGKPKPLPVDLQLLLDNATQGVLYFSLGSNVRSLDLTESTQKMIKDALSELPYLVLWKWESDKPPDGVGPNVITRKWFPQHDILAHKNIRGFVTQGGLQSTEEAITFGVPMVGIPHLGDQEMNVKMCQKRGISLFVDRKTMTKDMLKNSILEIIENPIYREKIQEIKKIILDEPMTGLEKAIWWSEYVIRHKGAHYLKSPAVDMPFWEFLMLDVILVILSVLTLSSFAIYKLFSNLNLKNKEIKHN